MNTAIISTVADLRNALKNPEINILRFSDEFNDSIELLRGNKKIIGIGFGNDFNQTIEPLRGNQTIRALNFGNNFNQAIDALIGKSIQILKFGNVFNQPIVPLGGMTKLKELSFGYSFEQSIEPLCDNTSIETLEFGNFYTELDPLSGNKTIKTIKFTLDEELSGDIVNVYDPLLNTNINSLILGGCTMDFGLIKKYIKELHKINNKSDLEQLYLRGVPIPIKLHMYTILKTIIDPELSYSFSKLNEPGEMTVKEVEVALYWVCGNYQQLQEIFLGGKNEMIEMIGITTNEIYDILRDLTIKNRPFVSHSYIYRGISGKLIYTNPVIGEHIVFPRFTATSIIYEISSNFAYEGQLFLLEVDENTPGLNLLPYKVSEDEVLLPNNTMWECVGIIPVLFNCGFVYDKIIHLKYIGLKDD